MSQDPSRFLLVVEDYVWIQIISEGTAEGCDVAEIDRVPAACSRSTPVREEGVL